MLACAYAGASAQTLLIENVRIENVPVLSGAGTIDGHGEALLPGLFDLHSHLRSSAASGLAADCGKETFSSLTRKGGPAVAWTGADVRDLVFELSGPANTNGWLEIDNLRFY